MVLGAWSPTSDSDMARKEEGALFVETNIGYSDIRISYIKEALTEQ